MVNEFQVWFNDQGGNEISNIRKLNSLQKNKQVFKDVCYLK